MTDDTPTMPDMMTRAREYGITLKVSSPKRVPAYDDPDGWEHDRYRVKLMRGELNGHGSAGELTTTFRKGVGHQGSPPTLPEVLDALVSDADSADETFEDWCGNYGYDTDSRKAEAMWKACRKTRDDLIRLLGADRFHALAYETERL